MSRIIGFSTGKGKGGSESKIGRYSDFIFPKGT
jgi:hypothetical protein